jgi:vitamin B12 transporter
MRKTLALLAAGFCVPALAQEPPVALPETVVTATRLPTPVLDIPAGVTVIDRKMIETHGYNTLTDALAEVPGLHVSQSGGPGGQASVFIRGTNSNHVLVLRDGMPIGDASDSSGAFNFGVDTLYDIERIEVIRGPMAALYGSGAIGGVINLISRRGSANDPHWFGDLAGGYPAQIQASVGAAGVTGPIDYALTAESQSRRGYDSTPQRQTIYTGTPQGFRDRIGTLNLGYTPVDGTRLSLFLRAREALFGFNAFGSPTFDAANSSGDAVSLLGRVGLSSTLFGGMIETGLFLGRLQEDRHYKEPLDPRDPNQASSDSRYHSYRTDLQWNNTVHLDDVLRIGTLSDSAVTVGYEHTEDTVKVRVNDNFGGFPFGQSANASMKNDAVHGGAQTTLWNRLTLTGQVRQDWVDNDAPTTWRLGAVVDMREIGVHLKGAYGTAFRAPSLFDRFGVDSFGYVGNPGLKPERAQGWEIGFTKDQAAFGRADFLTFGATYFNQQVRNLIVAVFSPVDTAINVGSAHVDGVETEAAMRPFAWLILHGTWTFTETHANAQPVPIGTRLLRRPQHAVSFDASIMPVTGLRIVPEMIYTGAARDFLYDNTSNGVGYGTGQHGLVANLTVTYDVTPAVQLYGSGRNLFGSRYEPVNGYQMPGTVAITGVRVRM